MRTSVRVCTNKMASLTITNLAVFFFCLYVFVTIVVPRLGQEFLSRCFGLVLSVVLSWAIAIRFTGGRIPSFRGKAVLVTGCDTGIGNALARHLHMIGFRVFAGCLVAKGEEAMRLKKECSGRLEVIQLDVTSDRQVAEAVSSVKSALAASDAELWGVVNNAGVACWGAAEWVSLERYQKLADVNLWGLIRVTKAFLPLIRKSKGRVVNMSSMLGHFSSAYCSPYCITKYGVQAFTDSLRGELMPFGVSAVIVEPGNFSGSQSAMFSRDNMTKDLDRVWSETPEHVKEVYGKEFFEDVKNGIVHFSQETATTGLMPVVDACTCALIDKNPQERYFPGNLTSKLSVWMYRVLPSSVTDAGINMYHFLSVAKVAKSD